MTSEFKEGKKYVVTLQTNFVGEFVRYETDERTKAKIAVFATGGSGRNGPYERAARVDNIVSSELTKTHG